MVTCYKQRVKVSDHRIVISENRICGNELSAVLSVCTVHSIFLIFLNICTFRTLHLRL